MLVKVWTPDGDDLIGLSFDSVKVVDSMIAALTRCRTELSPPPDNVHPLLRFGPAKGPVH